MCYFFLEMVGKEGTSLDLQDIDGESSSRRFVVDEVMWRVDDLSAALDLPVDDSCEFTEEVKRTVMAVRRQGEELQRHLSEIAFDATKYVHDLGEGHSISCLGIHGLQLLEQLATKVRVWGLSPTL